MPTSMRPESGRPVTSGVRAAQPRRWMLERVRLVPGLLVGSAPWVRRVFDHAWAPMQALEEHIRRLPPALLDHLLCHGGGFVAITREESQYVPGPATLRGTAVENVAYLSVQELIHNTERPLHVIGHLIDHYLGCGGASEGRWLSEGGGTTAVWEEVGERLHRLFALGYGVDEVAQSSVRDYFAQSLAHYCWDRQGLSVADPQIAKWMRSTLWSQAFWRAVVRHEAGNAHRGMND